jgi:hypothetical protein
MKYSVEHKKAKVTYVIPYCEYYFEACAYDFGELLVRSRKLKGKKNRLGKMKKITNKEKQWLTDLYLQPFNCNSISNFFVGIEIVSRAKDDSWWVLNHTLYDNAEHMWVNQPTGKLHWGEQSSKIPETLGEFLHLGNDYGFPLAWNIDVMRYYFPNFLTNPTLKFPDAEIEFTKTGLNRSGTSTSTPTRTIWSNDDEDFDEDGFDDYTEEDNIRLNQLIPIT